MTVNQFGNDTRLGLSAHSRGVHKGRKASIDPAQVKRMKADGMGPSAIAKTLKIGRASVYRALSE